MGFMRPLGSDYRDVVAIAGAIDPRVRLFTKDLAFEPAGYVDPKDLHYAAFTGAPVFADGKIVGLVRGWDNRLSFRYSVVPTAAIVAHDDFVERIKAETGTLPMVSVIEPPPEVADAIKAVAEANPSNIQEVSASALKISNSYYENVLDQAKRSFSAAIASAAFGLALFVVAVVIALLNRSIDAAIISATGGTVVEVISGLNFWLYSKTSTQLESFHRRLDQMQRYLVSNSVCMRMGDPARTEALKDLVRTIAQRPPTGSVEHVSD
jgi:hypothetical protein